MKNQPLFESRVCSRCGGEGYFNCWSHVAGGECFKCHGSGHILTKRGRVAQEFLTGSMSGPVGDLTLGSFIQYDFFLGGTFARVFAKITAVGESTSQRLGDDGEFHTDPNTVNITLEHGKYGAITLGGTSLDKIVRIAQTGEQKRDKKRAALSFQETLTKAGTVRKHLAKKSA